MSSDPQDFSMLAKVIGAATAVLYVPWKVWSFMDNRFAKKSETAKCLEHIEKLYQNAETDRKITRDLHDQAMKEVRDNQKTIIEVLLKGRP